LERAKKIIPAGGSNDDVDDFDLFTIALILYKDTFFSSRWRRLGRRRWRKIIFLRSMRLAEAKRCGWRSRRMKEMMRFTWPQPASSRRRRRWGLEKEMNLEEEFSIREGEKEGGTGGGRGVEEEDREGEAKLDD
jgi:hypothetical protein